MMKLILGLIAIASGSLFLHCLPLIKSNLWALLPTVIFAIVCAVSFGCFLGQLGSKENYEEDIL